MECTKPAEIQKPQLLGPDRYKLKSVFDVSFKKECPIGWEKSKISLTYTIDLSQSPRASSGIRLKLVCETDSQ